MNTYFDLWKRRIVYFLKLHYQFVAFQFDPVILGYTIGFLGLLGYSYFYFIKEYISFIIQEPWFTILQIITLWIMLKGRIKGYLKIADEVFLSPMDVYAKKFVDYSERFSIAVGLLGWGLFVALLYLLNPFLQLGNVGEFLFFFGIGAIVKVILMNLKFILYQRYHSLWGKVLAKLIKLLYWGISFVFIRGWFQNSKVVTSSNPLMLALGGGLLVILILIIHLKKKTPINWSKWIEDESNERARLFSLLLQDTRKEGRRSKKSTSPVLSGRKLEPFNRKGALLLLYFRILVRGRGNILFICQIVAALAAPIVLFKEALVVTIIHFIGAFLLSHFLASFWGPLLEDVWVKSYPFTYKDKGSALPLAPMIIVIPIIILLMVGRMIFSVTTINPIIELAGMLVVAVLVISMKSYTMIINKKA